MNIFIVIKTSFEAIHNWPDCDIGEVLYLRNPHRHIFHVVMKWKVDDVNRKKEFITVKSAVHEWINIEWDHMHLGNLSCEMLAVKLMEKFKADFVSVFEDNENGAEVII